MMIENFFIGLLFGFIVALIVTPRPYLSESWPTGLSDEAGFDYFERKSRRAYAVTYTVFWLVTIAFGVAFVAIGRL